MHNEAILAGKKVTLRPLTVEDVPLLARWFFDPEVVHWLQLSEDPPNLRTIDAVRERFEHMQADPGTRLWRIDTPEGKPIGQIEMVDIHPLQKRAELHLCIGEKEYWSGGYGSDAIKCVLQYGFETLGLPAISNLSLNRTRILARLWLPGNRAANRIVKGLSALTWASL